MDKQDGKNGRDGAGQVVQGADSQEAVRKMAALIKDIRVAMMTTLEPDGCLRSRPMATQPAPFDGSLYFFTQRDSTKVDEIQHHRQVNIAYSAPESHRFVSVSGKAHLLHDQNKMKELWNPALRAWFPKGLEDPTLALLQVDVEHAEYWDTPGGMVVHLIGLVKALATGQAYSPGEHQKIELTTDA